MKDVWVAAPRSCGNYEIDVNDRAAIDRLKAREPNADIWLVRIGLPAAAYFRTPR
jgi:hypothetical protein